MEAAGAILLAAGHALRMGCNKMLLPLFGKTVLERSFEALCSCGQITSLVLVASGETMAACEALAAGACKPCRVVRGGEERQDSVLRGLRALADENVEYAVIHDGARCLVTREVIERTLESARRTGSGVAAVPAKDTVKRADGPRVLETLRRSELQLMQTPQTFRFAGILRAYEAAQKSGLRGTDDASLLEALGEPVYLTQGDYENIKLTTEEDVTAARAILSRREGKQALRIGFGEDVHQLVEGRRLVLGGVEIPHEKGLLGHSDADVLTHALMDALLGALALGDIGRLFPDSDPAYEGADSLLLLREVMKRVTEAGYELVNADCTVIAQAPRLAPYREEMRQKLAEALGVGMSCVGVKATTTEHLGFEGRKEGISARCTVLLQLG